MKINLSLQLVNGTKDGQKVYGPGIAEVPDGLAKQCLRDGFATELSGAQKEALAAAKAEIDAAVKAEAEAKAKADAKAGE